MVTSDTMISAEADMVNDPAWQLVKILLASGAPMITLESTGVCTVESLSVEAAVRGTVMMAPVRALIG